MPSPQSHDPFDRESLNAVAENGARRACQSLGTLIGRPLQVRMSHVELVDDLQPTWVDRFAGEGVVSRARISGPPDGDAFVSFPEDSVRVLCDALGVDHDRANPETASMLAEVANIVTGSYLTELGDGWGGHLDPTPMQLGTSAEEFSNRRGAAAGGPVVALACGFGDDAGSCDLSILMLFEQPAVAAGSGQELEVPRHG